MRLIRCTIVPQINHEARINHGKGQSNRTGERTTVQMRLAGQTFRNIRVLTTDLSGQAACHGLHAKPT
jgi:hypothetical protein